MKQVLEIREVTGRTVGHRALEVVPDEFVRVELGRVAGKTLHVQARMPEEKVADQDATVGPAAVPEQHHGTAKVPEQLLEEGHHLRGADVLVPVEAGVQGEAAPSRRDRDR